jgi:hypothetical protein
LHSLWKLLLASYLQLPLKAPPFRWQANPKRRVPKSFAEEGYHAWKSFKQQACRGELAGYLVSQLLWFLSSWGLKEAEDTDSLPHHGRTCESPKHKLLKKCNQFFIGGVRCIRQSHVHKSDVVD